MRIVHPERKSDDIDTKRWKIRIIENNKWNIQLLMEQNREKCKKRKWNENSCKCNNDLKWKMLQLTWYHVKCHRFSFRLFHFKNSFLSQETWGCDTNTNLKIKKSHTFANRCENDYKCVDIKMYLTIVHLLELNNGTHIRCERKMKKKKQNSSLDEQCETINMRNTSALSKRKWVVGSECLGGEKILNKIIFIVFPLLRFTSLKSIKN